MRAVVRGFMRYAVVFLVGALVASLFWNLNQILLFKEVSYAEDYDYVLYLNSKAVKVKNGTTGRIEFVGENLTHALGYVLKGDGLRVFIKRAEYNASNGLTLKNLRNVKIISNGARINLGGSIFAVRGDYWDKSRQVHIEGLTIFNGSLLIENSFMTTVKNCIFEESEEGIILLNTNSWTECTKIEDCYFNNVKKGIVFKTPRGNGTPSYANTEIKRCYFELTKENSIGVHVEPLSDFNEGLIQNVRVWMGGVSEINQTGLFVEGSMLNTLVQDTVFESFADNPKNIFGIHLGPEGEGPILGHGIVFCGNLTEKVYNPFKRWIYGAGGSFKVENVSIPIGVRCNYGVQREIGLVTHLSLPVYSLNVKIRVHGEFLAGETVFVRFRLKFLDSTLSESLELSFKNATVRWLSPEEWLIIWPDRNIIQSLVVDAKTLKETTNVAIFVSVYGQYG
ncbi:MAG: hypothetical protein RMJ15_07450 [Nitrososphaerota archaeon]|nr:hypothetical protein [Nitrososphaerota archaeon]